MRWFVSEERHDPVTGAVTNVVVGDYGDEATFAAAYVAACDDLAARKARGAAHPRDLPGFGVRAEAGDDPYAVENARMSARFAPLVLQGRRRLRAQLAGDGGP